MKLLSGLIISIGIVLFASDVAATNLLDNPDFSSKSRLRGWTRSNPEVLVCPRGKYCGSMQYIPTDCCGDANSGSAVSTSLSNFDILSQCVDHVAPNTSYDFGVRIRRSPPAVADESPRAGFSVTWYSGANCDGLALSTALKSVQAGDWALYSLTGVVAPSKTSSAKFSLLTNSDTASASAVSPVQTEFDNAFFGPSGTVPVELQSFDVE